MIDPLSRAKLPRRRLLGAAALGLTLLARPAPAQRLDSLPSLLERLDLLPGLEALLLGEQHDASDHQRIATEVVRALSLRQRLAAVVLEMLPAGRNSAELSSGASEEDVRKTLAWDDGGWPWPAYGPVVMAAVRAGIPVLGGDLAREQLRASMGRSELEQRLSPAALARQMQLMREGHCNLLPESQIRPMARMQIARDLSLADALMQAARTAQAGQMVLMLCGSVHADKTLGVPQHLPAALKSASVRLLARGTDPSGGHFDAHWLTEPAPSTDHCAALRERFRPSGRPSAPG